MVSYAVAQVYTRGARVKKHEYLQRLVEHPDARQGVRWDELRVALEAEGFTVRISRRGPHATCYHPKHPRQAIFPIALPHSGRRTGETIRPSYIRDLCQYLEELWAATGEGDNRD